jgi:drug/metabolite transporter (DMT)-like permease
MLYLGEIFALTTAICWSFGTILFGYAGRRVGALTVNAIRIPMAALLLVVTILITQGMLLPPIYTLDQIGWLALSGFIGLVIGDSAYLRSLVLLGPRLASLVGASAAIFAVVISWIFLGQKLSLLDLTGIAITLVGIGSVTLEKNHDTFGARPGKMVAGYLLGAAGGLCQAVALVTAKAGMGDSIPALNASMIRMVAAAVIILAITIVSGKTREVMRAFRDRRAVAAMGAAALIGPSIGIWLSLLAIQYTKIGVAATLMATTPIWVIPLVMVIHKERPSVRAIAGTIVAVAGVALLFLH